MSEEKNNRFIWLPEVLTLTGLGKSTVYALRKIGDFPSPIKISGRCSAWVEAEIYEWMDRRAKRRLQ